MNKEQFLTELRRELHFLPAEEVEDAVRYYEEYFDDATDSEEEISQSLGSPQRVAEVFRKEYDTNRPLQGNELATGNEPKDSGERTEPSQATPPQAEKHRHSTPVWAVVLLAVAIIFLGVPVLKAVTYGIWHFIPALLLILLILAIIHYGRKHPFKPSMGPEHDGDIHHVQTCSDIRSVRFSMAAGQLHIQRGDSFSIKTEDNIPFKSYIRDGIWYVEVTAQNVMSLKSAALTVVLPENFIARSAIVRVGAGTVVADQLSAAATTLEVDMGTLEVKQLTSGNCAVRCHMGSIKAQGKINGDCNVKCGMGSVMLGIDQPATDYNYKASVGMGKVTINGESTGGVGGNMKCEQNGKYRLNVDCGMGEVIVKFLK